MTPRLFLRASVALCVLALCGAAAPAFAGSMTPPGGPVGPTMKTLNEVEPRIAINAVNTPGDAETLFKITQPGSYYLTGNVVGVAGKDGIQIHSSGVTIDLMGFGLVGVTGSLEAIAAEGTLRDIAITNGAVRDWGWNGIQLTNVLNIRIADVRVSRNNNSGIVCGSNAVVTRCTSAQNGNNGVHAADTCVITECAVRENSSIGIVAGSGCVISACAAQANGSDGIRITSANNVFANTCALNGEFSLGAGIRVTGNDNRLEGNNCTGADRGITIAGTGNFVTRNTCSGNVTNWDVFGGNVCLVVNATTSASAILGNSGGVAPGSTDPNANFSY